MPTHRPSRRPSRRAGFRPGVARQSLGLWPLLLALAVLLFAAGYCFGSRGPQEEGRKGGGGQEDGTQGETSESSPRQEPGFVPSEPAGAMDTAVQDPEVLPAPAPGVAKSLPEGGGARVALVIDDLGRSLAEVRTLRNFGVPLTYAVLPFESHTPEVVERLRQDGEEILCHLPMEARNGANPGPGALRTSMDVAEVRALTRRALEAVAGAVGVNNHMGSSLTADPRLMTVILEEIGERQLFFLDSRTSSESVGYRLASEMGIAAAERQVFLDPDPSDEAVRHQFRRLLDLARRGGAAIAIGHPYPSTLKVLAEEIPRARARGYDFVPVSYLVDRIGDLP